MKGIYISDVMGEDKVGKEFSLKGWVYRKRVMKDKIFIVLRDSSGIIQCLIEKEAVDNKTWEDCKKIQIEGSIEIKGVVEKDQRAPGGFELKVKNANAIDIGDIFPLKGDETPVAIMDWRHLWIRSRRFTAISKVRDSLTRGLVDYFIKNKWYWVFPPIITPTTCEETTTLFELKYFDQKAYLSQSAQLYLEALIYSMEKVFSFTPSFRAEKSRTKRHLHEYWHLECEAAWMNNEEMMKVAERMIKEGIKKVIEEREKEVEFLGRDIKKLKKFVENDFIIMTYDEAIEELQKKGIKIKWGEDLGSDEERELTLMHDMPIFVVNYPKNVKPFYTKELGDGKRVKNFDLLAPEGFGEIISGSEREDKYDILKKKMEESKLPLDTYSWYLDLRKYGSVPHSGFGLGVDRMLRWLLKLDHIRDTLPFPRLRGTWINM